MKTTLAIVLLLVSSGCTEAQIANRARIKQCVDTIPVLRQMPAREYRTTLTYFSRNEAKIVQIACAKRADAVMISVLTDGNIMGALIKWRYDSDRRDGGNDSAALGESEDRFIETE